jgi:catechol 2,3-dioxygenase-like lactoylglutathione lyase family enzyme
MLGHLSFGVSDLARSSQFYDAALAPLGFVRVFEKGLRAVGYAPPGTNESDDKFALLARGSEARAPGAGFHLAFDAPSREAVDAFHAAALANGGQDDGAPGLRPHYGPTYYAAFVVDPDGYKLEAVHQ